MAIHDLLQRILSEPTPDDLWALHPLVLAYDEPQAALALDLARGFYCYLSTVQSKLTSKQSSSLSALLAAGSVSVMAAQDIFEAVSSRENAVLSNLLAGGLASILELASTFHHTKAWEIEFDSSHEGALWDLYAALWRLSRDTQPDLPGEKRQALIDHLLVVPRDSSVNSAVRIALIVRLYQLLLTIRLAPLLVSSSG